MKELSDEKLKYLCDNYINGNKEVVREGIRKMNKLQLANFMIRCSNYGMPRHNAYTQVQFALE